MKKIINGKKYDTETATFVASWNNEEGYSVRDPYYAEEELYRKRTGEYFIYGAGGVYTKYNASTEREWRPGERIIPVSYDEAAEWGRDKMTVEKYENEFGEIVENDTTTVLSISMGTATADKIRRMAAEAGLSVSAFIAKMFE